MGTDIRLNLDRTTQSAAGYLVSADKDSALAVPQYGETCCAANTEETCCAAIWRKPAVPQYGGNLLCRNLNPKTHTISTVTTRVAEL
jgi:hypothetical protein